MRAHMWAMLALAGWFMMIAPAPESLGKFDPTAPMMKWSSHSPMFRNKSQCESFRARAARALVEDNANADQFIRDDSMVLVVPLWASRCVNIGAPTTDSSDERGKAPAGIGSPSQLGWERPARSCPGRSDE